MSGFSPVAASQPKGDAAALRSIRSINTFAAFQNKIRDLLGKDKSPNHSTDEFERAGDGLLHLMGASFRAFLRIHPDNIPKEVPQAINFMYEVRQDLTVIECHSSGLSRNKTETIPDHPILFPYAIVSRNS
jgi:hypothetical protein